MNERSIIDPGEPSGRRDWLESYLPEGQLSVASGPPEFVSLATVRGVFHRQRWLLLLVVVAALTAGLVITLISTPSFRATSKVSVEPYGAFILEGQDIEQGIASNQVSDYLATKVELIKSRSLAQVVVDDRNLSERIDILGKDIESQRPPGISDEKWVNSKKARATSILVGSISADVPAVSWVIPISFVSDDPILAAEMANAYADAFIASETRDTIAGNEYAVNYLNDEIQSARQKLQAAEMKANEYARSSGIIIQAGESSDGAGNGTTLTNSNLSSIGQRYSNARAARIDAEQKWRALQNLPAGQLPEVQANPVLQGLISDRSGKLAELAQLRQRYNDEFPQIRDLLAQIEILDAQISNTSSDVKATVKNAFLVAQGQENALRAELDSLSGASLEEQDDMVELTALERDAEALRQQLRSLLDRYNQISSAATVNSGTMTKIEAALVPNQPFAPSLSTNLGIALVLGLAIGSGLAALREIFDDRIHSLDDVENKLGLPLIGHTPFVEESAIDVASSHQFTALMEAYSSIRAAIEFSSPRSRNVFQLTSSSASEGKSTTAVVLAELFARAGRKTLLVDADLRRPSVAKLLDLELSSKVGFVDVLLGHVKFQDALVKGDHENLDVLPAGSQPPNPAELLSSIHLQNFIAQQREQYSLILFDSCPVLGLADAPSLARFVDSTIFVLEANRAPFSQARTSIKRLQVTGGSVLGVMLTKYRAEKAGSEYGSSYEYYHYSDA